MACMDKIGILIILLPNLKKEATKQSWDNIEIHLVYIRFKRLSIVFECRTEPSYALKSGQVLGHSWNKGCPPWRWE
jgi:hypothetical protein